MRSTRFLFAFLAVIAIASCSKADKDKNQSGSGKSTGTGSANVSVPDEAEDIDSKDILARTKTVDEADVKHVLLAWDALAPAFGGNLDKRAAARTNAQSAKLAREILAKLKKDPGQIDALVKEHSEDPGSLRGTPYTVRADGQMVPEFEKMALRLEPNEAGIVKTRFGYHVMMRLAPPPPDPLASNDILARPAGKGPVQVQHVLIGWKGVPAARPDQDPRAAARDKAAADKVASEVFAKVKAGEDMAKLMKEFSEDPGSKDNGRIYDVFANGQMVPSFKDLSLRLEIGEAGMVISPFGWHVIKRVPPPPPDNLESAAILKREPVTQSSKVKHILLGWKEVNSGDPRATARSRADLEKLVKKTVNLLEKGEKIEKLMKELSEDPGSAASGEGYPVTPDAGLVQPFKDLGLRLNVGEVGVVKSQFGMHIIQRTE